MVSHPATRESGSSVPGGLLTANSTHATDTVSAALEMIAVIAEDKAKKQAAGWPFFEVDIGVHTGLVVAGVIGMKKFLYDIWGDTVNTARRMESNSEAGKIDISGSTYALINHPFTCMHRGKIQVKGKGDPDVHFVEEKILAEGMQQPVISEKGLRSHVR